MVRILNNDRSEQNAYGIDYIPLTIKGEIIFNDYWLPKIDPATSE